MDFAYKHNTQPIAAVYTSNVYVHNTEKTYSKQKSLCLSSPILAAIRSFVQEFSSIVLAIYSKYLSIHTATGA